MPVVLIVEDEPLIAHSLGVIIAEGTGAVVLLAATVAAAEEHLATPVHFALLDINLRAGTTFDLARA